MTNRLLQLLLGLSVMWMAAGCQKTAAQKPSETPIATARLQPQKTVVNIEGVATVTAGAFDKGFALQDPTGGIYVTDALGNAIKPGDRVRVSGKILSPNSEIWLAPTTMVVEGSGNPPPPLQVKTGAVGPSTEGNLIAVQGKITSKVKRDWPWGWKVNIDDGSGELLVFISAKTKIDVKGFRKGQQLRITGFSGRYEDHTEILPRIQEDIVIQKQ